MKDTTITQDALENSTAKGRIEAVLTVLSQTHLYPSTFRLQGDPNGNRIIMGDLIIYNGTDSWEMIEMRLLGAGVGFFYDQKDKI